MYIFESVWIRENPKTQFFLIKSLKLPTAQTSSNNSLKTPNYQDFYDCDECTWNVLLYSEWAASTNI